MSAVADVTPIHPMQTISKWYRAANIQPMRGLKDAVETTKSDPMQEDSSIQNTATKIGYSDHLKIALT